MKSVPAPSSSIRAGSGRRSRPITVKPGKGGAYNQVELKNLLNGTKLNERFRSAETVEQIASRSEGLFLPLRAGRRAGVHGHGELRAARAAEGLRRRPRRLPAGRHDGDGPALRRDADRHLAARPGDARHHRGRPGGQGPDRRVLLQAGDARKRHQGAWCRPSSSSGERIIVDTNELTYVRRAD